jgi:hypothetical protein
MKEKGQREEYSQLNGELVAFDAKGRPNCGNFPDRSLI